MSKTFGQGSGTTDPTRAKIPGTLGGDGAPVTNPHMSVAAPGGGAGVGASPMHDDAQAAPDTADDQNGMDWKKRLKAGIKGGVAGMNTGDDQDPLAILQTMINNQSQYMH